LQILAVVILVLTTEIFPSTLLSFDEGLYIGHHNFLTTVEISHCLVEITTLKSLEHTEQLFFGLLKL